MVQDPVVQVVPVTSLLFQHFCRFRLVTRFKL